MEEFYIPNTNYTKGRGDEEYPKSKYIWSLRLFVALYDYDPISQSPNEDAAEVNEIIKFY